MDPVLDEPFFLRGKSPSACPDGETETDMHWGSWQLSPLPGTSSEHSHRPHPQQPCPDQPAGLAPPAMGFGGARWWNLLASTRARAPVTPKGQTLRKGSHTGGKHNTHLYFLFLYFGGLPVAEFSSTCFQDKKAHGATCPKREGSSPPWTPPLVFFRAGEGTLYMQVVSSTPLCNCPCHP